ncbi:MAG: MBL fold metallo-hydrolase [Alphaproteobacteria bacterium]|nr:MAG: MBL fold metallo-hydrolase [Alphaproteobacteria bacterium]
MFLPSRLGAALAFATALAVLAAQGAHALEFEVQKVTDRIYVLVSDLGPRSPENYGINATLGLLVTDEGAVLIDSGAAYKAGPVIAAHVARVTDQPIRWVINTGAQDHRWLGNGWFAEHGAEIIALERTVESQKSYAASHLKRLARGIGPERLAGTVPYYADRALPGDEATLTLGGTKVTLLWPGPGHFRDDAVVIVPSEDTIFTGDLVFVERLPGVQGDGTSSIVRDWLASFERIAAMNPAHIVPGHGHACDLARARADTGDYLAWLIDNIAPAVEDFEDLTEVVDRLEASPFEYLANYDQLHRHNVNVTYLQLEAE